MSRKRRKGKHNKKTDRQADTKRSKDIPQREVAPNGRTGFLEHFSLTLADVVMFVVVLVLSGLLIKYIGEDRVVTIHLFVALVFAVLLFVTLRVNAWLSRNRAETASRFLSKKALWSCCSGLLFLGTLTDFYLISRLPTKEPNLEEPTLVETVTEAEFILGGIHFRYPLGAMEGWGRPPIAMGADIPFHVYVRDRRLLVDVTVVGMDGRPIVQIQGNRFAVGMTAWDHNSSKQALEVVDADQNPVFQMIYRSPAQIEIDGIFPTSGGILWATPFGTEVNPKPPLRPLRRIFKYPAWRYPGVFEEY